MALKSRLLRDVERQQISDDVLTEFAALLIAAFEIPEVAQAVRRITDNRALTVRATPAVAARGTHRTRGGGRGQ